MFGDRLSSDDGMSQTPDKGVQMTQNILHELPDDDLLLDLLVEIEALKDQIEALLIARMRNRTARPDKIISTQACNN